jgi:hypothetical protein
MFCRQYASSLTTCNDAATTFHMAPMNVCTKLSGLGPKSNPNGDGTYTQLKSHIVRDCGKGNSTVEHFSDLNCQNFVVTLNLKLTECLYNYESMFTETQVCA